MCRNSLFLLFYCKGQFLTQITPFQQHNIRGDGMSLELLLFRYRSHHSQQQLPTPNTPPPSPSGLAMSWHNMGLRCSATGFYPPLNSPVFFLSVHLHRITMATLLPTSISSAIASEHMPPGRRGGGNLALGE